MTVKAHARALPDLFAELRKEADRLRGLEAGAQAAGIELAIAAVDAWLDEELSGRQAAAISRFGYSTLLRHRRTGQIPKFTRRILLGPAVAKEEGDAPDPPARAVRPSSVARSRAAEVMVARSS